MDSNQGAVSKLDELLEGWGVPTPLKAHYYVGTFSLCGKRGFYRGPLELGNDDSPDNCAECKRKVRRLGHDPS